MKLHVIRSLVFAGVAGILAAGCGSDNGATPDGGGTGGRGGTTGGNGGASAQGGTAGTVTHDILYDFLSTDQGFTLDGYDNPLNLAARPADGGVAPDAGTGASLAFDSLDGNPANGSLKMDTTWGAYGQFVEAVIGIMPVKNLSGKTLHAKVKLVSATPSFPGGGFIFVKTGTAYAFGSGVGQQLATPGTWADLTVDLTSTPVGAAAGFDSTMVIQLGIHLYSGDAPATAPVAFPIHAVFQIDTITD